MSYISYELYHDSHNYGDQKFKEFKKDVNKSNASMRLMFKTKSTSTIYSKCNHVNRNLIMDIMFQKTLYNPIFILKLLRVPSNLRNPVVGPQEANTSCATVFQLVQGGL